MDEEAAAEDAASVAMSERVPAINVAVHERHDSQIHACACVWNL